MKLRPITIPSFTVFATSLPDPRKGCERITSSIWSTMRAHRCGGKSRYLDFIDCIFSGHSMILTVFLYFWISRKGFWPMKVLSVLSAILGFWAILANRSHYTVDIVIGVYVGLTMSFIVDTLLPIKMAEKIAKPNKKEQ